MNKNNIQNSLMNIQMNKRSIYPNNKIIDNHMSTIIMREIKISIKLLIHKKKIIKIQINTIIKMNTNTNRLLKMNKLDK